MEFVAFAFAISCLLFLSLVAYRFARKDIAAKAKRTPVRMHYGETEEDILEEYDIYPSEHPNDLIELTYIENDGRKKIHRVIAISTMYYEESYPKIFSAFSITTNGNRKFHIDRCIQIRNYQGAPINCPEELLLHTPDHWKFLGKRLDPKNNDDFHEDVIRITYQKENSHLKSYTIKVKKGQKNKSQGFECWVVSRQKVWSFLFNGVVNCCDHLGEITLDELKQRYFQ